MSATPQICPRDSVPPEPERKLWVRLLAFGLAYTACVALTHAVALEAEPAAMLGLPTGLYAAVLLRNPIRHWAWLGGVCVFCSLAFDLAMRHSLSFGLASALANATATPIGAWLLRRCVDPLPRVEKWQVVLGLAAFSGALAPAFSTTVKLTVGGSLGLLEVSVRAFTLWWSADAAGVLVSAPWVLAWFGPDTQKEKPAGLWASLERIGFFLALAPAAWVAIHEEALHGIGIKYLLLPFVLLAALRSGTRGVSLAVLVTAITLALHSRIHLSHLSGTAEQMDLQAAATNIFLAITSLIGLLLAAFRYEVGTRTEELRRSEARYRGLFLHSLSGVALHQVITDADGRPMDYVYLDANPAFEKHTGIRAADCVGRRVTAVIPDSERAPLIEHYGPVAFGGAPFRTEQYLPQLDRHFEIEAFSPTHGQFATVFTDVSERVRQAAEIRRLNRLYYALSQINQLITRIEDRQALFDGLCRVIVVHGELCYASVSWAEEDGQLRRMAFWDAAGEEANAEAPGAKFTGPGYPTEETWREGYHVICNRLTPELRHRVPARGSVGQEIQAAAAFPIRENGRPAGVLSVYAAEAGFFRDKEILLLEEATGDIVFALEHIRREAERRQAETRLRASLDQQTALLKEIHHRVKNNLQVTSSLINLQKRQLQHPVALAALQQTQTRIRAMALLHETLYQSGQMDRVDCERYLHHLCRFVAQSFDAGSRRLGIESRVRPGGLSLAVDQALCSGLIVNELLSNACKHAFPEGFVQRFGREAAVAVEIDAAPSGEVCLCVQDNGVGLPADFAANQRKSLGLDLVAGMTRQLNGQLEMQSSGGTTCRIRFRARAREENKP